MAIPWLIGAVVFGITGAVVSAMSDDDSSSSSSSSSRELEREQERAERQRQSDLDQAQKEKEVRLREVQNTAKAQHFITAHSLNISPNKLIKAVERGDLNFAAMQAYQSTSKFKERVKQIEKVTTQYKKMLEIERELGEL
jgi:hypothetical protein